MKANKNKFIQWAAKQLGEDADRYDIESEFDSELTWAENKAQFTRKFLRIMNPTPKEEYIEHLKEQEEKMLQAKPKMVQNKEVESYYSDVYNIVQRFSLKANKINLFFIMGRGGIGKSFQIRQALEKYKIDYIEYQSVTEATLPEILYTQSDKTLWFKDCVKMFNVPGIIALVKSATETDITEFEGKKGRMISIHKYSHELKKAGVPRRFMFSGNIIFDFNEIIHTNYLEDFNAMKSRGYGVTLVFSKEQVSNLMRLIARSKEELEVTEFLIDNYNFVGHNHFNLRTQAKALNTFYCAKELKLDWKELIMEELKRLKSRVQEYLYTYMGDSYIHKKELATIVMNDRKFAQTMRTAYRRIEEWQEQGEIFVFSGDLRNPLVSLSPFDESLKNELSDNRDMNLENEVSGK